MNINIFNFLKIMLPKEFDSIFPAGIKILFTGSWKWLMRMKGKI